MNSWLLALAVYNFDNSVWIVPKKYGEPYIRVRELQNLINSNQELKYKVLEYLTLKKSNDNLECQLKLNGITLK